MSPIKTELFCNEGVYFISNKYKTFKSNGSHIYKHPHLIAQRYFLTYKYTPYLQKMVGLARSRRF